MAPAYTLLSGATGFLGMHILKELLSTGHKVRVLSRSQDKGDHLLSQFSSHSSSIDVAVVSDQLADGAYDKATKGVEAIIHTASPFIMTAKDNEEELIKPALAMALNMLKAAAASPSVKRVVLTSSLAAIVDPFKGGLFQDTTYTSKSWNPVKREQAEGPALGYLASKTLAEKAAWDFVEKEKPGFDLVTLCPSLVVGAPSQDVKSMDKLNTSCANIYRIFDLKEIADNQFPCVVSVTDVAKAHVASVDKPAAGNHRFICNGSDYSVQFIIDALREQHPEMKSRLMVGQPGVNEVKKKISTLDTSPAKEILGIEFADWHQAVMVETVPALLKLEKELGASKK